MWLRRLVGVTMIVVCVAMNVLVLVGFFSPAKKKPDMTTTIAQVSPPPTVTITASPDSVSSGSFSALTWTTTGDPTECTASDSWSGVKTAFGAESTGRLTTQGNLKYTLACKNKYGTGTATVTIAVGPPNVAPPAAPKSNSGGSSSGTTTAVYCGGASPCYSASEVAKHGSAGNCWGWLGDRVINVAAFDAGFHDARSGSGSIQVGGVCGKDLYPAVNGSVASANAAGHNHQLGAKSSSDANYAGFFVGYYDASKP